MRLGLIPLWSEQFADFSVGEPISLELLQKVKHSLSLKEFCRSVNVEEDSVVQTLHLAGVSWPHDEIEVRKILLFLRVEELRKPSNLFIIVLMEALLDYFVHKVQDLINVLLSQFRCLIVERE